jgi:hypothetical protein
MKKTLLIAAAALAAGVITSQAQVYSQNIVGYVNVPARAGFTAMSNPLNNNNGNSATNLFDCTSGANDGNILLLWTGTKYSQTSFDTGSGTLFSDAVSGNPVPPPVLNPNTGFLFNNQYPSNNITFVGSVATDGTGSSTNVVGVSTNMLSNATLYVFASSKFPVGGGISSVLGLVNDPVTHNLDGSILLIPKIVSGAVKGYSQIGFDSGSGTGFSDAISGNPVSEPVIPVGGSFLFENQSGAPIAWVQSL